MRNSSHVVSSSRKQLRVLCLSWVLLSSRVLLELFRHLKRKRHLWDANTVALAVAPAVAPVVVLVVVQVLVVVDVLRLAEALAPILVQAGVRDIAVGDVNRHVREVVRDHACQVVQVVTIRACSGGILYTKSPRTDNNELLWE